MKKIILSLLLSFSSIGAFAQNLPQASLVPQDVARFIDSGADDQNQKLALKQAAAVVNTAAFTPLTSPVIIQNIVNNIAASKLCLEARYPAAGGEDKFAMIEKMILNDPQAFTGYQNFKAASQNVAPVLPQGQGCTFFG